MNKFNVLLLHVDQTGWKVVKYSILIFVDGFLDNYALLMVTKGTAISRRVLFCKQMCIIKY